MFSVTANNMILDYSVSADKKAGRLNVFMIFSIAVPAEACLIRQRESVLQDILIRGLISAVIAVIATVRYLSMIRLLMICVCNALPIAEARNAAAT